MAKKPVKINLRDFLREEYINMTEEDVQAYIDNPKNPLSVRQMLRLLLSNESLDSVFKVMSECYGKPKETIAVEALPKLNLSMFGEAPVNEKPTEEELLDR